MSNFKVDLFDRLMSDVHNPITLELQGNIQYSDNPKADIGSIDNVETEDQENIRVQWDNSKKSDFKKAFPTSALDNLANIIRRTSQGHTDKHSIDDITDTINTIYIQAGKLSGVVKSSQKRQKRPRARKNDSKPWYNTDCEVHRKEFFQAKNELKRNDCPANIEIFKSKSNTFKNTMAAAYNSYHKDLHEQLRQLKSSNPKDYWRILNNAVDKKKDGEQVTLDAFRHHFENLNETNQTKDKSGNTAPDPTNAPPTSLPHE